MKILKTVKKITLRTKISKYRKTTHELLLTTSFLKPKSSESIESYRLVLMLKPKINVLKQLHSSIKHLLLARGHPLNGDFPTKLLFIISIWTWTSR